MRRSDREINDQEIIKEIIKKADVCRIALANDNIPYIVTMNFGYSGGDHQCLYFHCADEGRKLEMIKRNNYVCFEMDVDHKIYGGVNGCDWGMKFRSVVGYGRISVLTNRSEKTEGLNCLMSQYSDRKNFSYDEGVIERTKVLRLDIEEISGKEK